MKQFQTIDYETFKREYLKVLDYCFEQHFSDEAFNIVYQWRLAYPEYYATFRYEDEHDLIHHTDEEFEFEELPNEDETL